MNSECGTPKFSQCSACSNTLLESESKLLKCLHGVCNNCLVLHRSDSGVKCVVCKSVSDGDLINYPVIPPKGEMCKTNNCHQEAVNMCKVCFKVFCESCSVDHKQTDSEHQQYIKLFQTLQNKKIQCLNCNCNPVNIWCIQCSTMNCGVCHAENHREHDYISLKKFKDKQRCEIISVKDDLVLNSKCIEKYVDLTESHISKLKKNHNIVMININKQWENILKELMHCKKHINDGLEKLHQERVSEATKHNLALQTLQAKNEYNTNFTSSILQHNKNMNDIRLVKILKDEKNRIKSCIKYNSPDLLCNINPEFSITNIIKSSDEILKIIRSSEKLTSPSNIDLSNNFGTVMPIKNIKTQIENSSEDRSLKNLYPNLDKLKEESISSIHEISSYKNTSINKESMGIECIVISDDDNERSNLHIQTLTHTGKKLFQCKVCKKSFSRNSYLNFHMGIHTSKRPYKCSICKKSYSKKCIFKIHTLNHTEEI